MRTMIVEKNNGFSVQGRVAFDNVLDLRLQGEKLLKQLSSLDVIEINLSDMKEADASSLSLLLCWMRCAKKNKSKLQFFNLSESLQGMCKMFGLVDVGVCERG